MSSPSDRDTPLEEPKGTAEFETRLTALLGGDVGDGDRVREASLLRGYAARTGESGTWEELLALAERPDGSRATVARPPDAYWVDFDSRLMDRLKTARSESLRPRMRIAWAIAAVLTLVVVGGFLRSRDRSSVAVADVSLGTELPKLPAAVGDTPEFAEAETIADDLQESGGETEVLPRRETSPAAPPVAPDEAASSADPIDDEAWAVAALESYGGSPLTSPNDDDYVDWFPEADDLSETEQRELLRWLREQNAAMKGDAS